MSDPNAIGGGTAYAAPEPANVNASGYDDDNAAHFRASQVGVSGYMAVPAQLPRASRYEKGQPMPQYIDGDFSSSTLQHTVSCALPWARLHGVPSETDVVPGMTGPLTPLERQWIADMLDAGA